jgi:hypothetical protein
MSFACKKPSCKESLEKMSYPFWVQILIISWLYLRLVQETGQHRVDSPHSISVQFQNSSGQDWWLSCVYGPQNNNDKILFLQELREIRIDCQGPWVIVGDFNLIYKAEDKNNDNFNKAMMGRFRNFIKDTSLIDLPLIGRKYTWSNHQATPTLVRLDRVLCSTD